MQAIDTILINGRIYTMNPTLPEATALAFGNGVLAAVGSDDPIRSLATPDTRVIDLQGRTVLPGFFDAHCHLRGLGITLGWIDTSPQRAPDVASLIALLKAEAPDDSWIIGRGYDQNRLAERRPPTALELDQVSTERPLMLIHASGHGLVANSVALRRAGVTADTPNPSVGTIERDAQGNPTGLLTETAMTFVRNVVPAATRAELVAALTRASAHVAAMGITSAVEASATLEDLDALRAAFEEDILTVRCHPWLLADILMTRGFLAPETLWPEDTPRVRVRTAKLFSDGALSTRTAYLREPYADNAANFGTPIWDGETLFSLALGAQASGWLLAIHAIGDAAIDLCLDTYERLDAARRELDPNAPPLRHRIEHAMLLHDDQLARMAALGVLPVFQPEFVRHFGDAYVTGLGEERASNLMPSQKVLELEAFPLAFSSDLPVVPGNPLDGIKAACERLTPSGRILGASQRTAVGEALRAYTAGAAYACQSEQEVGSLAPGLRADFIILSQDPHELPLDEWADALRVTATVIDGQLVYGDWEDATSL